MRTKQTLRRLLIGTILVVAGLFVSSPVAQADCGNVQTSVINCTVDPNQDGTCSDGTTVKMNATCPDGAQPTPTSVEGTSIWQVLLIAINILTAGVAIAAIAGLIYASILYTSAGGSTEQIKKAYGMFTNIVIGIIAYALMFAGLNFLIPGGLFN